MVCFSSIINCCQKTRLKTRVPKVTLRFDPVTQHAAMRFSQGSVPFWDFKMSPQIMVFNQSSGKWAVPILSNTVLPNSFHLCFVLHIPLVLSIQCTPHPQCSKRFRIVIYSLYKYSKYQRFDFSRSPFFSIKLAKTNNHVNSQFGESRAKIYSDIAEGSVI